MWQPGMNGSTSGAANRASRGWETASGDPDVEIASKLTTNDSTATSA